jgi:CRP-like cAMP-binding protein
VYRRRRTSARASTLNRLALFGPCSVRELSRIERLGTEVEVEAGRILTVAGEPGAQFFVIVSGTASVWRGGTRLDVLPPGSFFGELALLDGDRSSATVVANTRMRLFVLSRREFFSPHFLVSPVVHQILMEMGRRLRRADTGWAPEQRGQTVARLDALAPECR